MDNGHSVKALLIYPEFAGCPFTFGFYERTLLLRGVESIPSPSVRSMKGETLCH